MVMNEKYVHYFSVLKCFAMFSVICLHTFCTPVNLWNEYLTSTEIFIGVFVSQFLKAWAVPIFIMVSGALFLDKSKDISIKKLYGKYILRLVLILIIFGTLYSLMEIVYTTHSISFVTVLHAFKNMYSDKTWDHMWFIYMIIGLYICTPPLKLFISKAADEDVRYLIRILLIFTWLVPFIDDLTGIKFGIHIPVNSIYLLYYIIGYAIHNEITKIDYRLSIIFIVLGIFWCSAGLFLPGILILEPYATIRYINFIGFPLTVSIFAIIKEKSVRDVNYIDTNLVPLSLGVYITHQLFLNIFYKILKITPQFYNIWFCWVIVFLGTSICSLFFVWLLRKIPLVRKFIF